MTNHDKTLRSPDELIKAALAPQDARQNLARVAERYAIAIPPAMARLIDPADPGDPIARQFIPSIAELDHHPEEHADPIGDHVHSPVKGIVHRYRDRALLKIVSACPVYCRFCFRREMVGPKAGGSDPMLSPDTLQTALDYIANDDNIWEVILTGGDPFILSPRRIGELTRQLAAIGHVKIIRWHTRVPAVDPARITADLVSALKTPDATTYVVLHANHPRELTSDATIAIAQLIDAGLPMLSQTVLLKGVNDNIETLSALMRRFVELRIKPYYLHHGDLAPGTSHLRTSIADGQRLMRQLQGAVSGLCMPTHVLDIPGGHGKVPVGPVFLDQDRQGQGQPNGVHQVLDLAGKQHAYPPQAHPAPQSQHQKSMK